VRQLRNTGRRPGKSWWAVEVGTPEQFDLAMSNLAAVHNRVDYVLTHSPSSQAYSYFGYSARTHPWGDKHMDFLDWIEGNVEFDKWYFGHLHEDFHFDVKHHGLYTGFTELL